MHLKSVTFHPEKYPTAEQYPFNQRMFRETQRVAFTTPVTMFVGENGTGKSTFLEALCRKCGIHMWRGIDRTPFRHNPYEEKLHQYMSVEWSNGPAPGSFFGSETFHDFAEGLDEWAASDPGLLKHFGGESLVTLSHGQSLMSFFRARYRIKGLYVLDEPETALSPKTQLELLKLLRDMGEAGHAQFIVATHSAILLACPGARILSFDSIPVREVDYEETEHFRIYKSFLEDPQHHM